MWTKYKDVILDYLLSSAVTFVAAFSMVLLANIDQITAQSFQDGTVVGIVFAGLRAGLKAALEGFIYWYKTR